MARVTGEAIAKVIARLLQPYVADATRPLFWVWEREDRAIVSVNPNNITNLDAALADRMLHHISTALGGCLTVKTNSRGVYYQIGYEPVRRQALISRSLELSEQPGALYVPMGMTESGPLWINLAELDAVLVGGARRLGKTMWIHGLIQALIHGGEARLVLWDGKLGAEFGRYAGQERVEIVEDLTTSLQTLRAEMMERAEQMRDAGETNYQKRKLPPIVVVIDEAAFIPELAQGTLIELTAKGGAMGIHPVIATQRTGAAEVAPLLKANLSTRISFAVPAVQDSMVVLGRAGAERLPRIAGRLLVVHQARVIQAQAFRVELGGVWTGLLRMSEAEVQLAQRAMTETGGRLSIPLGGG
jgi:hypothetical protein